VCWLPGFDSLLHFKFTDSIFKHTNHGQHVFATNIHVFIQVVLSTFVDGVLCLLVEPGAGALAEPEGKSYEFCIDIDIVLTLSILLAINNNKNEVNNYMYFDEQIFLSMEHY
jgi:hypothetical protein